MADQPGIPGKVTQYIRDVPASCTCMWEWISYATGWQRIREHVGCPWHDGLMRMEIMHDAAMAERDVPWSAEVQG